MRLILSSRALSAKAAHQKAGLKSRRYAHSHLRDYRGRRKIHAVAWNHDFN